MANFIYATSTTGAELLININQITFISEIEVDETARAVDIYTADGKGHRISMSLRKMLDHISVAEETKTRFVMPATK